MLQFKVAKNVVGDRRLTMIMRPENLEMKIFLEYNLIALNYSVLWKACSQCQKYFDALTARKVTQEIQTRDPICICICICYTCTQAFTVILKGLPGRF